jgi:hypothetical protein
VKRSVKSPLTEQLCGPQHEAKLPRRSACPPGAVGEGRSQARSFGVKAMEAVKSLERSREDSPVYRTWTA